MRLIFSHLSLSWHFTGLRIYGHAPVMIVLASLVGVILGSQVRAAETPVGYLQTAADLMRTCKAAEGEYLTGTGNAYNRGMCWGYLQGMWDGFSFLEQKYACIPKGVTWDQMRLIVLKWGADHPAELHQDASFAYIAALLSAFPCPPSQKPKK